MGGAINRSFISAHILLSAYFLTIQIYKHMRLITFTFGMCLRSTCSYPCSTRAWLLRYILLEGERVLGGTGRQGVELPEGGQEVRKLLNNFYLLTSLNRTWSA